MGHHHVIASERPVPPTEHLDPVERIAERGEHGGDVHLVASIDKTSETLMGRHPRPDPRHRRVERSDGKNPHELSYRGGPPESHAPPEQKTAPDNNEDNHQWVPDTLVDTRPSGSRTPACSPCRSRTHHWSRRPARSSAVGRSPTR